jgi:crossover junction endodeoxyribonuclease RusA
MITITLPWPDKRLSPNARSNRFVLATAKKEARETAELLMLEKYPRGYLAFDNTNLPLELVFFPPDGRHYDQDNNLASCKAALDGVSDALGIDDTLFEPITLRRGAVVKGGQVIVRIGES